MEKPLKTDDFVGKPTIFDSTSILGAGAGPGLKVCHLLQVGKIWMLN